MTIISRMLKEPKKEPWRPDPLIVATLLYFAGALTPVIVFVCWAIHTGWRP